MQSQATERWNPPVASFLKLNVDVTIFNNQIKAGVGVVVRDESGDFIAVKSIPIWRVSDPSIGSEDLGVREALSLIKLRLRFPAVSVIDMDTKLVYNALPHDEPDYSYFGLIIDEDG